MIWVIARAGPSSRVGERPDAKVELRIKKRSSRSTDLGVNKRLAKNASLKPGSVRLLEVAKLWRELEQHNKIIVKVK